MKKISIIRNYSVILTMTVALAVAFLFISCTESVERTEETMPVENTEESTSVASTVEPSSVASTEEQALVEDPIGIITMTTKASEVWFLVAGTTDFSIDWGDGKKSNVNDAEYFEPEETFVFSNEYFDANVHNIVITGNVTRLNCGSGLTALDVSRNPTLTRLDCSGNQLTTLDLSKNTALEELRCEKNELTALDVSWNIALKTLECDFNQIKSWDVSKNTALCFLSCISNGLTASELNDLFRTLPLRENKTDSKTITIRGKFAGNPGSLECDRSIAYERGWGFIVNIRR